MILILNRKGAFSPFLLFVSYLFLIDKSVIYKEASSNRHSHAGGNPGERRRKFLISIGFRGSPPQQEMTKQGKQTTKECKERTKEGRNMTKEKC